MCAALSILYGKRFDNHGFLVSHGCFYVPDFGPVEPITYYTAAPYSHQPRRDLTIPLELHRFGAVAPLFTNRSLEEKFRRIFFVSARFYLRALQMFDVEPEFAYLDLITCGEILANYYDYASEELYNDEEKGIFESIRKEMPKGDKIVRKLQGSMRKIKQKYILTLTRLLTDSFFTVSECREQYGWLKKEEIEKRLKAAYDLRSLYVHTGIDFGRWTHRMDYILSEVQLGKPVVENKEFEKAIALAPTFFGLERIMRYCLLRFLHLNGVQIDPALDDSMSATAADIKQEEAAPSETTSVASTPKSANGAGPQEEDWTEEKNRRRCELIDRKYDHGLTPAEDAELALLQDAMYRYIDKVAPLPLDEARSLHQELLQKAAQAQDANKP
jgi:hypothetical protein